MNSHLPANKISKSRGEAWHRGDLVLLRGAAMDALAFTAMHAAQGKAAAVAAGYWTDPFASFFAQAGESPGPLINRGQYVRVAAIRSIVQGFLEATAAAQMPAQIVSLGAGFDALFWQLSAAGVAPRLYIELDQSSIVRRKRELILSTPALRRAVAPLATSHGGASGYTLAEVDLNDVNQMAVALEASGWQAAEPTLIIAECLLMYLRPEVSDALVGWFANRAPCAALIAYDAIGPDDPFGQMMMDNLKRRGCPLLGLRALPDTAAHEARCMRLGWNRACAMSMLSYHDHVISAAERMRICKIAMLDELEEWRMLLEHYCVVLAVRETFVPDGAPAPLSNLVLRTPAIWPPLCTLQPPDEPNLIIPSLVASSFTSKNGVDCRTDEAHNVDATRGGSNATAGRVVIAAAVETSAVPLSRRAVGSTLSSFHGAPPGPLDRMIEDAQEECGWDLEVENPIPRGSSGE